MPFVWVRESVQSESPASDISAMTFTQAEVLFGTLTHDDNLTRRSDTRPVANWLVDRLNEGVQIVTAYAPSRIEIISCTTVASSGLYRLPYYAISTSHIRKVKYAGDVIERCSLISVFDGEIANVDEDSIDSDGDVVRWVQQGMDTIRLIQRPASAATLKVIVATMPPPCAVADIATTAIPLPAHLKTAPSIYAAAKAALLNKDYDDARYFSEEFWRLVNKKVSDDVDPVEALDLPHPGAARWAMTANGDNY